MRKPTKAFGCLLFLSVFSYVAFSQQNAVSDSPGPGQDRVLRLIFNGDNRMQQIQGFGVNANTRSWQGAALEPALDLLIDSMKSNLWRVVVETVEKWEDVNDNDDPFTFNWDYYNKLYQTPKFFKVWEMIRYLNKRGITDNLMVNFMGWLPSRMGGEVIKPAFEDEYVEMLVSFFYYARNVQHLQIKLVGPMNEPDMVKEGPTVGAEQYVRVLKKLIGRMNALGMQDVRYVAPDLANMKTTVTEYLPLMMKDTLIMKQLAYFGMHSYGGYYWNVNDSLKNWAYPHTNFWITEWNAWRNGLDDGKIGIYDFNFARECVKDLLELIENGASAGIVWEGYDSYYEHHFPSKGSYWGVLSHDTITGKYLPRKHFYAISQVSKFVKPGSWQIAVSGADTTVTLAAFYDEVSRQVSIVAVNNQGVPITVQGLLENLPGVKQFDVYRTDSIANLLRSPAVSVTGNAFTLTIPGNCILTLTGKSDKNSAATRPEPRGWFTGDIHVHRSCGEEPISEKELSDRMRANDLDVVSLLADMGNAEVKHADEDLPKVNGQDDASYSLPGHILHWDTEWHWDATYSQFGHQALGGHLVLLGLQNAHQIWTESPYKVLDWAGKQGAVRGFAHMQYLDNTIQNNLDCCIPVDYPVEAALGNIEFVSEDVHGGENAILAYYRLLNCGFRIALAAGTDYPCNFREPVGSLLTYVNIPDKRLTYRKWINGIGQGRTVVSRNAHHEFLDLTVTTGDAPGKAGDPGKVDGPVKVNGPGSDIKLPGKGFVTINAVWTANKEMQGRIELVSNGKIIGTQYGTAAPGSPVILSVKKEFLKSGWICARRMDTAGHVTHTSPVYVTINNRPVRASAEDARFFIGWIDNILQRTGPGGPWNTFFPDDPEGIRAHYLEARKKYEKILDDCLKDQGQSMPRLVEKQQKEAQPVLVIAGKGHFGLYTGELLKAEGINEFTIVDPSDPVIDAVYLKNFDLVILAAAPTDAQRVKQVTDYVGNGGNLITFFPTGSLGPLLGFKETGTAPGDGYFHEGYLLVDPHTAIGRRITGETMQYHGYGEKVSRTRGETIATFFTDALTGTAFPAVIHSTFGKGSTVSFLYNMPESVVAMHQGNVKWKNQERDGMNGLRNMDMFVGVGNEPNWIDKERIHIPQADEQIRLFSHAVEYLLRHKKPLPRLWYFPADQKALTILTCDGENKDAPNYNEKHIEEELQLVRAKGGAMTVYLVGTGIPSSTVNRWRTEGHEIGIHFDNTANARNPTYENMSHVYSESIKDFLDKYDDSTRKFHLKTVRNHWITWVGWSTQAEIESEHDIHLDCNSYKFDNSPEIIRKGWIGKAGYYTGSGIPMKFADESGKVLDIYQSETQVVDEQLGTREGIFNTYKVLLDRSLQEENYAVINTLFHPDKTPTGAYMDDLAKVCDYSKRFGVPLWDAERLLQFLRARDEASFTRVSWKNGQLRFRINSTLGGEQLTCMVPAEYKSRRAVSVRRINSDLRQSGPDLTWKKEIIKGTEYVMVTVASGNTCDIAVSYSGK